MENNNKTATLFNAVGEVNQEKDFDLPIDVSEFENPESDPHIGLFIVKKANEFTADASSRPNPKKMFGQLWSEHEICILFADSNAGKSILAVQIADAITKGKKVMGLEMDAAPQKILYCDFELSDKQFELRYMNDSNGTHYVFSDKFLRVEINPDADFPDDIPFEDYLKDSLEKTVIEKGVKIVIVDNITFLNHSTEQAKDALPLMKWLKSLGRKYNLSILVLAHTPKRNQATPITKNDLQGSKMLYNFCDSCFAIGVSVKDESIRYIKELKQRFGAYAYDSENVIVCEISKPDNFTQFNFIGFGAENEHLKQRDESERQILKNRCIELSRQGKTQREIHDICGISVGTVNRYLKKKQDVE